MIAQFSADLIGDYVQGSARRDINRIIRMNALAGNSSLDAMKEITVKLFGSDRAPKATDLSKGRCLRGRAHLENRSQQVV